MARDKIHNAVKNALIKDGWTITHDPYPIIYEGQWVSADLGAEKTLAAEKEDEKIVVEIKSFIGRSAINDFQKLFGQYSLYKRLLEVTGSERKLLVAIDKITYETDFLQHPMIVLMLTNESMPLIIVDLKKEMILQWIP